MPLSPAEVDGLTNGAAPARTLIVFLDVDGPVIPSTQLLVDPMSAYDRVVPRTTVAVLNRLCERTGALIVVNSTHSVHWDWAPDIVDAMVAAGLDRDHVHPFHDRTRYPDCARPQAVEEWLAEHPEVEDWVAFDDDRFTRDPRLIWVDPHTGLCLPHLNEALERFGHRAILIFV